MLSLYTLGQYSGHFLTNILSSKAICNCEFHVDDFIKSDLVKNNHETISLYLNNNNKNYMLYSYSFKKK
jgi:hypothetical protein